MLQSTALVHALKRSLKRRGLTYREVAKAIGLSEVSVKRLFASGRFTLARFEAICQLAELELTDLLRLLDDERPRLRRMTADQERELVQERKLALVAICVQRHWRFEDIVREFELTRSECIQRLVRLDRMGLIELLPNNRFKLLVAQDFGWIPGGPMERFFDEEVLPDYLSGGFQEPNELKLYINGNVSRATHEAIYRKLRAFAKHFGELHEGDTDLPVGERESIGVLVALRRFEPEIVRSLRRLGQPGGMEPAGSRAPSA